MQWLIVGEVVGVHQHGQQVWLLTHLSKSLQFENAELKKFWMAASNVAVHNIGLLSWQIVRNWNVLEEEVFAGGWELFNGLAMNREAVDEKYFSFLQAAL